MGTGEKPEKPYACSQCDYRARQKDQVKTHVIAKHTSERPFSCDNCGKTFKQKLHLDMHQINLSSCERYLRTKPTPTPVREESAPILCKTCGFTSEKLCRAICGVLDGSPGRLEQSNSKTEVIKADQVESLSNSNVESETDITVETVQFACQTCHFNIKINSGMKKWDKDKYLNPCIRCGNMNATVPKVKLEQEPIEIGEIKTEPAEVMLETSEITVENVKLEPLEDPLLTCIGVPSF